MHNVFILGGTSGIGKALGELLIREGYNVVVGGRNVEKVNFPAKVKIDVTMEDCREILNSALHRYKIDTFIYCSGTGFLNLDLDITKETPALEVNVAGFVRCIVDVYKFFESKGNGTVAVITSVAGERGLRFAPAYSASKRFMISYLQALRQKSIKEKRNIKIIDIRPGFVDTPLIAGDSSRYAFLVIKPGKAAKIIYKSIKSGKNKIYVPWYWSLLAFVIKTAPRFVYNRV